VRGVAAAVAVQAPVDIGKRKERGKENTQEKRQKQRSDLGRDPGKTERGEDTDLETDILEGGATLAPALHPAVQIPTLVTLVTLDLIRNIARRVRWKDWQN